MDTRYIHGETAPAEIERLEKQARFLSRWILEGLEAGPGAQVLDLACGTGAMLRRLAARLPDVSLVGCDLSAAQLRAAAQRSPGARLVRGDAGRLPFRSAVFDLVHWSWLLEHVPPRRAVDILREVRRIVRPTGLVWMTEVDNASLAFWPRLPLAERCFEALWTAQAEGGGDPIIGRKLYGLCTEAGFSDVAVFPTTFHLHGGSPPGYFRGMLEEFAEILVGAAQALPRDLQPTAAAAAQELLDLERTPGASFTYTAFRVRASR